MEKMHVRRKFIIAICISICLLITLYNPFSIIPNRELEKTVREQINKPYGKITSEDCSGIIELDLGMQFSIISLNGLQHFSDLEKLNCTSWLLSDISSLKELYKLKELYLDNNRIKDLQALSGLINLEELKLYNNRISDLSPLASLANLKYLVIGKNPVDCVEYEQIDGTRFYTYYVPASFTPLAGLNGLRIASYADYSITVKDGSFVDSNTLSKEEILNPPEEVEDGIIP